MALQSTLIRFHLQIADVSRGFYDKLELRVAMHPSEAAPFLITRVLAYCLNYQEGIEFSQGIATPEDPAIWVRDRTGITLLWIDIGNPSARRLHKASKASRAVQVFTFRDIEILKKETEGQEIHKKGEIEVFALNQKFLNTLGEQLQRDNKWDVLRDEEELSITIGEANYVSTLQPHRLL